MRAPSTLKKLWFLVHFFLRLLRFFKFFLWRTISLDRFRCLIFLSSSMRKEETPLADCDERDGKSARKSSSPFLTEVDLCNNNLYRTGGNTTQLRSGGDCAFLYKRIYWTGGRLTEWRHSRFLPSSSLRNSELFTFYIYFFSLSRFVKGMKRKKRVNVKDLKKITLSSIP